MRSPTPPVRGRRRFSRRLARPHHRSTRSSRRIARRCPSLPLTSAGCSSPCVSMGGGLRSPWNQRGTMPSPTPDILRGTLDLLILKALSWGPAHGYAVARWIETATNDGLAVGEGTLYPALHRLEE